MKKRLPLLTVTRSIMPILVRCHTSAADGFVLNEQFEKAFTAIPVRVVPIEIAQDALVNAGTRRKIEREFGRVTAHGWTRLYALSGLIDAVRYGDADAMDRFLVAFRMCFADDQKTDRELDGDPRQAEQEAREFAKAHGGTEMFLTWVTAITCAHVRFCAWMKGTIPRVGLLALTLEQAIGVHLLLALQSPAGVGVCKKCGHNFKRMASDDKYCSLPCGNAARQAEYRKRHGKLKTAEFYPVTFQGVVKEKSKFKFRQR